MQLRQREGGRLGRQVKPTPADAVTQAIGGAGDWLRHRHTEQQRREGPLRPEEREWRRSIAGKGRWILAALLGLLAMGFLFYAVPLAIVTAGDVPNAPRRLELRNDVRGSIAQLLAGIVLAGGLVFTARTVRATREAQITDRFSKAIEHLGNDKLDIRLGGIYALERIARDSERDHGPVIEVLTAYVRRYVRPEGESEAGYEPPSDIQSVVTVLGRRDVSHDYLGFHLNLSHADLRGVDFRGAGLRGALTDGGGPPASPVPACRLA